MAEMNERYGIRSIDDYHSALARLERRRGGDSEKTDRQIEKLRSALATAESMGIMPEQAPKEQGRQEKAHGRIERGPGKRIDRNPHDTAHERKQEASRTQQRRNDERKRGLAR